MFPEPCLQVHDMTFRLDPHVPHVIFCEQQQPLPSDVIFSEQISVKLHVTRSFSWEEDKLTFFKHYYSTTVLQSLHVLY